MDPTRGEPGAHTSGDCEEELIRQLFSEQAHEHLDELHETLVRVSESCCSQEQIDTMMRAAHSLKGDAAVVGFEAIEEIAHALEDGLALWRTDPQSITPEGIALRLRAVDCLRGVLEDSLADRLQLGVEVLRLQRELRSGRASGARPCKSHATVSAQEVDESRRASGATLRVGLNGLDNVMRLLGEIAMTRGRLAGILEAPTVPHELIEVNGELDPLFHELNEQVVKLRMIPLGPLFRAQARAVEELSTRALKLSRLSIEGEEIEVDATIVQALHDPIVHLVRNAVHHGIEAPEVREQRGKDRCGTITLRASQGGRTVVLEVADDGQGLDLNRIRQHGIGQGLLSPQEALDEERLRELLFTPGFSTAEEVNEVAGRGVGLDVVRRSIESLRGRLDLQSAPGEGTRVILRVPCISSKVGPQETRRNSAHLSVADAD